MGPIFYTYQPSRKMMNSCSVTHVHVYYATSNVTLTSEVTLLLLTDDSGPGQASKAELEKKCLLLQQQVHEMEVNEHNLSCVLVQDSVHACILVWIFHGHSMTYIYTHWVS